MSADRKVNKLAKWRVLFAGWQLGTRAKGDPECDAVKDHREVTILMRAELNALVGLLVEKGVFTAEEFTERLGAEAEHLDSEYEKKFPGVRATDLGLEFDQRAIETMRGWKP